MALELKPRPKRHLSSWRNADDNSKSVLKTSNLVESSRGRVVPPYKINERFMAKNNLEAVIKVTWTIDAKNRHSEIFALNEVNTFSRITRSIANNTSLRPDNSPSKPRDTTGPNLHIDKFTVITTNQHNEHVTSEINLEDKTYRVTNTEHSPETFNALMRATASRMSAVHNTCACGDEEYCEAAKRCPEIRIWLSSLDGNNQRRKRGYFEAGGKVQPDKIIVLDQKASRRTSSRSKSDGYADDGGPPKVMISAACLRRLRGNTASKEASFSPIDLSERNKDMIRRWQDRNGEDVRKSTPVRVRDGQGYGSLKPELRDIPRNDKATRKQAEVNILEIPSDIDSDDMEVECFQRSNKDVAVKFYDPGEHEWRYDSDS